MASVKYQYNPVTCNYEPVRTTPQAIVLSGLGFLSATFVLALGIFWAYATYFESPKEIQLKQENTLLLHHYKLLQQEVQKGQQVLAYLQDKDDEIYRTMLEAEPIPHSIRQAGIGGTDRYQSLMSQSELIAETQQKVDQLKRQLYIQSKSYDEIVRLAKAQERRLACIPSIQPISIKGLKRISSPFGMRRHPIHGVMSMHEGVDLSAPRGTKVYATGDGVVKVVSRSSSYGKYVLVDHGYGFVTKYCHLNGYNVKRGQKVIRGQCIGYVGNTGTSTAPHLHYEVIKNRKRVDPANYFFNDLDAEQYDMLLELASRKIVSAPLS